MPREYLLEASISSWLPLHELSSSRKAPAEIVEAMIRACPDALRYRIDNDLLPAQDALLMSAPIETVKVLMRAYPESVDLYDIITRVVPLHRRSMGSIESADTLSLVQLHVTQLPDSVGKLRESTGSLPFHYACYKGQIKIVQFLYEKYPEAISFFTPCGRLPLHLVIENCDECNNPSEMSDYEDIIRFLVRHYPQAANRKKVFSEEEDEDPTRMLKTPIELCRDSKVSISTQRLLLRACPEADEQRWRQLNYEARREALFLAFVAISRQQGPESLVWQLRRLMHLDKSMSLLKHVMSFL